MGCGTLGILGPVICYFSTLNKQEEYFTHWIKVVMICTEMYNAKPLVLNDGAVKLGLLL